MGMASSRCRPGFRPDRRIGDAVPHHRRNAPFGRPSDPGPQAIRCSAPRPGSKVVQTADPVPTIAIALEQNLVRPRCVGMTVAWSEQINEMSAALIGPRVETDPADHDGSCEGSAPNCSASRSGWQGWPDRAISGSCSPPADLGHLFRMRMMRSSQFIIEFGLRCCSATLTYS